MKAFETEQDFCVFQSDVEGTAVSYTHREDGSAIVTCSDGVLLLVSADGDSRIMEQPTQEINLKPGYHTLCQKCADALNEARSGKFVAVKEHGAADSHTCAGCGLVFTAPKLRTYRVWR